MTEPQEPAIVTDENLNNPPATPPEPEVPVDDFELDGQIIRPSFLETLSPRATEPTELPEDIQRELARLKDIERLYNEMTSDVLYSAVDAYKKAGGTDINVFVQKISGSVPDPDKMTPLEIFEFDLRNNLAKEAKMDEAEIEEAVRYFAEKPKFEQIAQVKDAKKRLSDARMNHLLKVNEELSGQAALTLQQSDERAQLERDSAKAFVDTLDSMVGKTWHRMPFTKDKAEEVKRLAAIYTIRNPKTGLPDVESTIQFAIPFLYLDEILKANIRYGHDRGLEAGGKLSQGSNGANRTVVTRQASPTSPENDPYEAWKKGKTAKANGQAR